jgi:hypothetical protein
MIVVAATGLLSSCLHAGASVQRPVHASTQPPAFEHTVYEHHDHRDLPVGTKIYYEKIPGGGMSEQWVRPGQAGPLYRKPDVVIIP